MKRFRGRLLLLSMVWPLWQGAVAQAQGKVALLTAATSEHQVEALVWADLLEQKLMASGYKVGTLVTEAAPKDAAPAARNEVRAVGLSVLDDLSEGATGKDMLARYGGRIEAALALTSTIHDAEGRGLLWNLCVLRVHLLLTTGGEARAVEQAVGQCQRRFPGQHDFGRVWAPEVLAAFKRQAQRHKLLSLAVESSPTGCEVFLFGAPMGTTPLRTEVFEGPVELQVRCPERTSRVHHVQVKGARDITIFLKGDEALARGPGGAALVYADGGQAEQVVEHAQALAGEEGAEFLALVSFLGDGPSLRWFRTGEGLLNRVSITEAMTGTERDEAVLRLFAAQPGVTTRKTRMPVEVSRSWGDYALSGALVLGGAAGSVIPWLTFARDGECVNTACTRVYDGRGPMTYAALVGTAVAVSAGVVVLWRAPFGRQKSYRVQGGVGSLQVRGTF